MRTDVNTFLGAYPWRRVPGTSPDALMQALDRIAVDEAWVSHLPGFYWKDPTEGNAWLFEVAGSHPRLRPVPAVHPGLRGWEETLSDAASRSAPAVRCDPGHYGLDPAGDAMRVLVAACGAAALPLMMAVRLEDARFEETLAECATRSEYALTGAVFAQDRAAVLRALEVLRFAAGNFYVNDKPTGAVVGQQPFGGSRLSGTNDKAGSILNLLRWVSPRTIKETFVPPTDWRYPYLG